MLKNLVEDLSKIKELHLIGVNECNDLSKLTEADLQFIRDNVDKLQELDSDYVRIIVEHPNYRDKLLGLNLSHKARALVCNNIDLIELDEEYLREYLNLVSDDTVNKLKTFSLEFVKNFMKLYSSITDFDEATELLSLVDTLKQVEIKFIELIGQYVRIKDASDLKDMLQSCNNTKLKHLAELMKDMHVSIKLPNEVLKFDNKKLASITKFVTSLTQEERASYITNYCSKSLDEQLDFINRYSKLKKENENFSMDFRYNIDFCNVMLDNSYKEFISECHKFTISNEVDNFLAFIMRLGDENIITYITNNLGSIATLNYNNLLLDPEVFEDKIDFKSSALVNIILSNTINNTSTNYKHLTSKVTLEELRFLQEVSMNYTLLCNSMKPDPNRLRILQSVNELYALEGIQSLEELEQIGSILTDILPKLRADWDLEFINYNSLLKGIGKIGLNKMRQLKSKDLANIALNNLDTFRELDSIDDLIENLHALNKSKIDDMMSFYGMPDFYKTKYKENLNQMTTDGSLDILHSMSSWDLGKCRSRARKDLAFSLVKGKFQEYKYSSLDRELIMPLTESQKSLWMTNYTFTLGDYVYEESDSVTDTLTYFTGKLNYKDGSNKDLCFCLLDGCKKIWLVKKDNKVVLKVFVRLTKIDFNDSPPYMNKNSQRDDYLSIFIEDVNNLKLAKSECDVVIGNIQSALLRKAYDLQAQVISKIGLISRLCNSQIIKCNVFSGLTHIDKLYDVSTGRVLKPMNDGIYVGKHVHLITT